MNPRRVSAAILLTVSVVAVLGVVIYVERLNTTQTLPVFIVRADVAAGTPYDQSTVQPVSIRAEPGVFAYQRQGPSEYRARFASNLHAGDIVRGDDLVPYDSEVEVALTVTASPPIAPGDSLDVYATINGNTMLLGQHLRATSAGTPLTLLVPAQDEAAWAAVASSSTPFHAVKSAGGAAASTRSISGDQAIRLLCGSSCRNSP